MLRARKLLKEENKHEIIRTKLIYSEVFLMKWKIQSVIRLDRKLNLIKKSKKLMNQSMLYRCYENNIISLYLIANT